MKNKTPKTIADLNINWTFCKGHGSIPIPESKAYFQFRKLNPSICDLRIKQNTYTIKYKTTSFTINPLINESLASFITYLNYLVWSYVGKSFKLRKFERISDTEYIIHGE